MKLLLTEEIELSEGAIALLERVAEKPLHKGFDRDRFLTNTPSFKELLMAGLVEDTDQNFYYTVYCLSARGLLAYNACTKKS